MISIQDWMHDYMIEKREDKNEYVGKAINIESPKKIAEMIQEDLQNSSELYSKNIRKYSDYKNAVNHLGIMVMNKGVVRNNTTRPLNIKEFRGFALSDDYAPLIFVNGNDSENGKTFTLLHELAHLYLDSSDLFNQTYLSDPVHNQKEQIANAVAAEVLLPDGKFKKTWYSSKKKWNEKVNDISKQFRCSRMVVARRAYDHNFISKDEYDQTARQSITDYQNSRINKRHSGGSFYNNMLSKLDGRFLSSLDQSIKDGSTQYMTAYQLTGTNRKKYDHLMENLHKRGAA